MPKDLVYFYRILVLIALRLLGQNNSAVIIKISLLRLQVHNVYLRYVRVSNSL